MDQHTLSFGSVKLKTVLLQPQVGEVKAEMEGRLKDGNAVADFLDSFVISKKNGGD